MKIIDYAQIEKNIEKILKTNSICMVLKNDAYGFGLENMVKLGLKYAITSYAVNSIEEAIKTRKICDKTILLFGRSMAQYRKVQEYNILPTANSIKEIKFYTEHKIPFSLEIDSGMNRFGVKKISISWFENPYLKMVYIHFYKKSEKDIHKMKMIAELCKLYKKEFHFGGSLTYGTHPYCIRVGRMLYENSLSFYGKVVNIKNIQKGESVGYEGEYVALKNERIAVIDVGYYNGLHPQFKGEVYALGKTYKIIGRVCMNHCFILIDEKISIGQTMEFFGKNIPLSTFLFKNKMTEYQCFLFIR